MGFTACIVAAGKGERAGGGKPKQFRSLAGEPMLAWSIKRFSEHPECEDIIVALPAGEEARLDTVSSASFPAVRAVAGGETRTESVARCLEAVHSARVLIHDAARPLLSKELVDKLLGALEYAPAAAPGLPVADALARVESGMVTPVSRESLMRIQTPQAFHTARIREALAEAGPGASYPDEVALAREAGIEVRIVNGEERNFKVTYPDDFTRAEMFMRCATMPVPVTGSGFDVHRLAPGDGLMLCGIKIECPYRLVGHSDADAGLHALTDAVLGAAGRGDIGEHFPPSDSRWKDAASDLFLNRAVEIASECGVTLIHADVTLICERPKIGPHRTAMRERLSALLGVEPASVNIKATTTEGLGFTGRGEGIAAQALVTGMRL